MRRGGGGGGGRWAGAVMGLVMIDSLGLGAGLRAGPAAIASVQHEWQSLVMAPPLPRLRLRGGMGIGQTIVEGQTGDQEADAAADEEFTRRFHEIREQWIWCMQDGGRILGEKMPDFETPDCDKGEHNWNYNGDSPGPEVWRNPPPDYAEAGFRVDPWTCPIHELWNDVVRMKKEEEQKEEDEKIDGPEMLPEQKYDHEGNPTYEYWDRDGGTRPFTNVRRHLPQGWRQLKIAGSTMILAPDGTFCCNDDPTATDPSTWGQDVKDTGEWKVDGPTWEQSEILAMRFNDEERTECTFMLHCENKDCGAKFMYTGEDDTCPNDEMPNIFEGNLCSDSECPDCGPIREEEEASVDENELVSSTPENWDPAQEGRLPVEAMWPCDPPEVPIPAGANSALGTHLLMSQSGAAADGPVQGGFVPQVGAATQGPPGGFMPPGEGWHGAQVGAATQGPPGGFMPPGEGWHRGSGNAA